MSLSGLHTGLGTLLLAMAIGANAADANRALEIVQGKCFICHGNEGESSSPLFPRLAGQHAGYVARQLADYKSGRRKSDTMRPMVEDLSGEDFAALGRYFESRPAIAHEPLDGELAQGATSSIEATPTREFRRAPVATAATGTAPTRCRGWRASTRSTSRPS